jgi:hypothetical protein
MVHAKSNWLNDLTKNCAWYMDDGALLVWLVRGAFADRTVDSAIANSRFHAACTFAFYVVPLEPNLCTAIFYGANMKRSMDSSVKMKLSYLRTYEAY